MKNINSLYIHIPFCLSKCKYCDFFSIADKKYNNSVPENYIKALCNELIFRLNQYKPNDLKTIYIGGGTPSLLTNEQLSEILDTVNKFVHINNFSEITIEINPDDVTEDLLKTYKDCGITRISMGIQSMNEETLDFAGRRASRKINLQALELIKKYWTGELSVDLISALPKENTDSFIKGLTEVVKFSPHHISLYSLTIEDETPFGKMYNSDQLEYDWDFADDMWLKGRTFLTQNGYFQYEVSNFSKQNKECKHNLTYWNHENYIGVGSGGTGTVYPYRWTNKPDVEEYIKYWLKGDVEKEKPEIIEEIDLKTEEIEFFMMGLRKLSGINASEYFKYFKENIPEKIIILFSEWQNKGFAQISNLKNDVNYRLNNEGILFLNKFLEEIFICFE